MKPIRNNGSACCGGSDVDGELGVAEGVKEVRRRLARLRTLTRRGRSVEDWTVAQRIGAAEFQEDILRCILMVHGD